MLLGGRLAEIAYYNEPTTGASNDLPACAIARNMVTRYGMVKARAYVPMNLGVTETQVFLSRSIGEQHDYSDHVAQQIDSEVNAIIKRARRRPS